jgi:hypothetical protein
MGIMTRTNLILGIIASTLTITGAVWQLVARLHR